MNFRDLKNLIIINLINKYKYCFSGFYNFFNKHEVLYSIIYIYIKTYKYIFFNGIYILTKKHYAKFILTNQRTSIETKPENAYLQIDRIRRYRIIISDVIFGALYFSGKNTLKILCIKLIKINHKLLRTNNSSKKFIPLYPYERYILESNIIEKKTNITLRIIDLIAPLGKGQRTLLVSPPRAGKTIILQNIAYAIKLNNPNVIILILLIDERPEEVTDIIRSVNGKVISSTFDQSYKNHIFVADNSIEKAKSLSKNKKDVVVLLDSITRLARAYNSISPITGRTLSGGIDVNALQNPKKFFGAARKIEGGGSLTIIATALITTGSKMDDVIFEEFKGTGNSEIYLDRIIANKKIYPSIDIIKSGTRKEELLTKQIDLKKILVIKKMLYSMNKLNAIEFLIQMLGKTLNNNQFLRIF